MARDTGSIVKMSRREGYALHPKAHKVLAKRASAPGQQSGRYQHNKSSQFSIQLREKQKVKRLYGLLEKQFSKLMKEASANRGQSGELLLQFLEQRADNVVYRAGFAVSRRAARQIVTHGHMELNGHRFDVPSQRVKIGDKMVLRDRSKKNEYFKQIDDTSPEPSEKPSWLKVNRKKFEIVIAGNPTRDDSEPDIKEQLIVEYYSR